MKKNKYTEPTDFIPKDIRKKAKIGEFNDDMDKNKKEKKERSISNEEFKKWLDE